MNADGTLTSYLGRLLQRSHSHSIHPVGRIKGDVVAVSQSQVLHQLVASWSIHCQCEEDVTGACPCSSHTSAQPCQVNTEGKHCLYLHPPTQCSSQVNTTSTDDPVLFLLSWWSGWSLPVQYGTHNTWITAAGPGSSAYSEQPPGLLSCSSWWHQTLQAPEVHSSLQLLSTALSSHSILIPTHLEQRAHPHKRQSETRFNKNREVHKLS